MSISLFSVVIITHNEEKRIAATLKAALGVTNDVVVVDSFSTDQTVSIAEKMGARVFQHKWEGYSAQKNFGNAQAKHDWILSVDADEVISDELAETLKNILFSSEEEAFYIPFRTNYCGKWINYGAWRNEKHIRLFNKRKIQWNTNGVHEGLTVTSKMKVSTLNGQLLHYSVEGIEQHLDKINQYTTLQADAMYEQNKRPSVLKMIFSPWFQFIRGYFLQLGFLDGFYGLVIAVQRSNYFFLRYAKLRIKRDRDELTKKSE